MSFQCPTFVEEINSHLKNTNDMKSERPTTFFVESDLDILKGMYPFILLEMAEVYIMQMDRVVFIGSTQGAINFMNAMEGIEKPCILHTSK